MTPQTALSLVLGGYGTGKTTALVQLFGRMQSGTGTMCVVSAPGSLGAVRDGLASLAQGVPVNHTPAGVEVVQELSLERADGQRLELSIPDYAGESLDAIVETRHIPDGWRPRCRESSKWILFVRVERMEEISDFATADALPSRQTTGDAALPLDMRLVELLQMLAYERHRQGVVERPALVVVMSCWDEITNLSSGQTPTEVLAERIPLLSSYVSSNWGDSSLTVVGLSAQGRRLVEDEPDQEFVDLGPERMGYLIRPDGSTTDDLTELLAMP